MPGMPQKLANRVRELRKARGLSQEELAARIDDDVSISTISRIEAGRIKLSQEWLERIGGALGVNPIELIADASSQVRLIPVIGRVSAGDWAEAIQSPDGWLPIPAGVGGPNAFALKPMGDSMNNVVGEGEFVVVDPDQMDLMPGRAYIVMNGQDQATFKRYRSDPPRLEPDSSNPEHQPIMIGREPFVILGRVVFAAREL
jgi:repressor LexA